MHDALLVHVRESAGNLHEVLPNGGLRDQPLFPFEML
jgi:hypothetical protein